jgi:hypothetical protein
MDDMRLPDCRPPRRAEGVTSASWHPELLTGDLVSRRWIPVTPASAHHVAMPALRGRALGICAFAAAVVIAHAMPYSPAESYPPADKAMAGAPSHEPSPAPACVPWSPDRIQAGTGALAPCCTSC